MSLSVIEALEHEERVHEGNIQASQEKTYLCALIGTHLYAIASHWVMEVIDPCPITPIPHTPAHFLGVCVRRGKVTAILDLAGFVGDTVNDAAARYVILQAGELIAAVPVIQILGIATLDTLQMQPPLPSMQNFGPFITGHFLEADRVLLALEVEQLLNTVRVKQEAR